MKSCCKEKESVTYNLNDSWLKLYCHLLIPCVNIINIKRTNFSYECCFSSFYYIHVTRKKAAKMTSVQKICAFNVDEIDYLSPTFFSQEIGIYISGRRSLKSYLKRCDGNSFLIGSFPDVEKFPVSGTQNDGFLRECVYLYPDLKSAVIGK